MPRRLIIVLIVFAALVIPTVILLFVVDRNPGLQNIVHQVTNTNGASNGNVNQPTTNTNASADNPDQTAVIYVSRNFAETFGSGNNENDFAHLVAAKIWGTQNFNQFLDRTITQGRLTEPTTPYHSFITKAVVIDVTKLAATTAAATIDTQRVELLDDKETVYYQKLLIDLVKVGDDWKVNAAFWQAL